MNLISRIEIRLCALCLSLESIEHMGDFRFGLESNGGAFDRLRERRWGFFDLLRLRTTVRTIFLLHPSTIGNAAILRSLKEQWGNTPSSWDKSDDPPYGSLQCEYLTEDYQQWWD